LFIVPLCRLRRKSKLAVHGIEPDIDYGAGCVDARNVSAGRKTPDKRFRDAVEPIEVFLGETDPQKSLPPLPVLRHR
jgi:hypothetical protein